MRGAAAVRSRPRVNGAFFAGALLLCLVVGRLLPRPVEALSQTQLLAVVLAVSFLMGVGYLAILRPRTALLLAFGLLGIVRFDPAPVDAVFALLIAATTVMRPVRPRVPSFVALPLWAFVIVSILSMTNAVGLQRALEFEGITIYMIILAVWLSWAFTQKSWVSLAVKTYIVVAAVAGLLGPVALYLPLPARNIFLSGARAEGLFKDPNVYSAFLVPAAIILLEEVTTARLLEWRRRVVVALFALVSIGIVVAYSRAAWLNYVIGVTTLIVVQAVRRRGLRAAVRSAGLLLVCGCVGFLLLLVTGSLAFLKERSHLQRYDSQRFANQTSAFSDMTRHVFGFGPGQTEIRLPISTHSAFARAAFEQGLLGLVTIALVIGGTLVCAIWLVGRTTDVNGVGTAALLGIWLGQVANGFFIDTVHWRHFWIVAGLIWCGYGRVGARVGGEHQDAVPADPIAAARGAPG